MDLSLAIDKVSSLPPVSLAIALIAVVSTIVYSVVASKGLPPGPIGLPFLGYWPFFSSKTCHLQLAAMKKKYGDVFSFKCSGRLYINLGTLRAVREAHVTRADCFGARVEEYNVLSIAFEDGVAFANGEPWKVLRKYFLQVLKERGLTSMKDSLSGSLYDSMNATVEHLRSKEGNPENIVMLLTDKCNAILRQTLFGDNGMTEQQVTELNEYYGIYTETMTPLNMLMTGNFAKFYFTVMPSIRKGLQQIKPIEKLLYKIIDEHKSSYDEEHPRDIIDDYIKERNLRRKKGDPTAQYFTDKALVASLLQFVGDGVLSVAAFVTIFLKAVTDYPEEQEKIYKELIDVVGLDRQPTIDDKSKLVYTNAFIQEVLRMSDFFPFFPSQECTKETTVCGYRIPVGTISIVNFYTVHKDSDTYEEPEKFNPSRYISKDGKKRAELPISFGMGRRSCMGESFTMTQVFLFLTTLVKNFRLTMAKGSENLLLDVLQGKLEICAHPRSQK